jgi:hypothetical protein
MIKNYIIIGLISILIVFGITISIKCANLEKENIKLKLEQTSIIDSIKIENEILEKDIELLEKQIISNENTIDSLKAIKQKVIVEYKYVVSKDLSEGVETLKNNLRCERYY